MNCIRDFIHRRFHRVERNKLTIQTYRSQESGFVTILHSEYQWRKVRNAFVKEHPKCACCNIERELEAHHVKPWHLFPDLRYEFSNLITLCRDCHFRFGHGRNWKKWNPEVRTLCEEAQKNLDNIQVRSSV